VLLPLERDAFGGSDMIQLFSVICAWTGEEEPAFQQLDILTQIPSSLTYGRLKLHPFWDPLRAVTSAIHHRAESQIGWRVLVARGAIR
jgi:hypothetical protein